MWTTLAFLFLPSVARSRTLAEAGQFRFEGTNMLIILYDCVASKGMKGRTSHLVALRFSGRHSGISIAKPFRWNVAVIVLFYTPPSKTMKASFEDHAGELSPVECREYMGQLKGRSSPTWCSLLSHPYEIVPRKPSLTSADHNVSYSCSALFTYNNGSIDEA